MQGQLTDNSWLLYPDVRLTGGFAFVIWFKGPHRGEFVLTMGGYHPDFHRDGYPQVPRLGLQWRVRRRHRHQGRLLLRADVRGGDGRRRLRGLGRLRLRRGRGCRSAPTASSSSTRSTTRSSVYARIRAGITIDTWFGEITFSVSIGARVEVEGPDFHGKATFEVGPCDVTVEFGSSTTTPRRS